MILCLEFSVKLSVNNNPSLYADRFSKYSMLPAKKKKKMDRSAAIKNRSKLSLCPVRTTRL